MLKYDEPFSTCAATSWLRRRVLSSPALGVDAAQPASSIAKSSSSDVAASFGALPTSFAAQPTSDIARSASSDAATSFAAATTLASAYAAAARTPPSRWKEAEEEDEPMRGPPPALSRASRHASTLLCAALLAAPLFLPLGRCLVHYG